MEKKMELLNIYLKIHQKRELSWEDLEYLARFDKECFEKTCKNVVYNVPQAKPVILQEEEKKPEESPVTKTENKKEEKRVSIERILENLKGMESGQFPMVEFDLDRVKNLLGNLYMEMLFPHNDKDSFYAETIEERGNFFDKKA